MKLVHGCTSSMYGYFYVSLYCYDKIFSSKNWVTELIDSYPPYTTFNLISESISAIFSWAGMMLLCSAANIKCLQNCDQLSSLWKKKRWIDDIISSFKKVNLKFGHSKFNTETKSRRCVDASFTIFNIQWISSWISTDKKVVQLKAIHLSLSIHLQMIKIFRIMYNFELKHKVVTPLYKTKPPLSKLVVIHKKLNTSSRYSLHNIHKVVTPVARGVPYDRVPPPPDREGVPSPRTLNLHCTQRITLVIIVSRQRNFNLFR